MGCAALRKETPRRRKNGKEKKRKKEDKEETEERKKRLQAVHNARQCFPTTHSRTYMMDSKQLASEWCKWSLLHHHKSPRQYSVIACPIPPKVDWHMYTCPGQRGVLHSQADTLPSCSVTERMVVRSLFHSQKPGKQQCCVLYSANGKDLRELHSSTSEWRSVGH